ncbi:MAG: crotonase/enoyl-CoA hydratase family protein [Acidimicrobiales bacterium]
MSTTNVLDRIAITIDDAGVADVRLNRPDKMNALDPVMFKALVEASDMLAADNSVRCVVLSGEGRAFCAGLDFSSFQGMADGSREANTDEVTKEPEITAANEGRITHMGQQAVYGWTNLPVPVIGAIHGHALGGGIQLALGTDIRFVHPETKMSVLEVRWGLVPDMTGTQSLIDIVGLDVAKELTWTGRMVSGTEAVELGLGTHLSEDPRADALAMAGEIAQKSPHAIRAGKRLLNNASKVSVAEGFQAERQEIGALIGSPNQKESIMAFFEKRTANVANPD